MIAILVALVSIGIVTVAAWFLGRGKMFPISVCPICAGTATTWIWILAGVGFGWLAPSVYLPVAGILMGGSAVGIAYTGEKYLKEDRSPLLWKALFIPIGFGTAWAATRFAFGLAGLGAFALLALAGIFLVPKPRRSLGGASAVGENVERLEKEMEQCC